MKRKWKQMAVLLCILLFCIGCGKTVPEKDMTPPRSPKRPTSTEEAARKDTEVTETLAETSSEEETEKGTEKGTEEETEEPESEEKKEEDSETEEASENPGAIKAGKDTFDYVALGNSVTCNQVSDLWWGSWGMAATDKEKDYVHIISSWLETKSSKNVTSTVLDLKKWELASDRPGTAKDYDAYFNEYTDLITIQTGENITEHKESLNSDYSDLLNRIHKKAPNAKILVLGEVLWPSEDIEAAKQQACSANGAVFVDMSAFLDGYESSYKSAVGTVVGGDDGKTYSIADEVVAAHPNNEGMACIAQQVIDQIGSVE